MSVAYSFWYYQSIIVVKLQLGVLEGYVDGDDALNIV